MDIFKLHAEIVGDYQSYIESFINIRDEEISEEVNRALSDGRLWPEPLLQFNPAFKTVTDIAKLTAEKAFSPILADVFWDTRSGDPYRLYLHQVRALELGASGQDFVVTSGTGSGKSLTFIGTAFNHLFQTNSAGSGIQAVFVYPMNALINSQVEELDKYAQAYEQRTGKPFPIRYAPYTGQQTDDERDPHRENPPDILLTNYMMLELVLTRHRESTIRQSIFDNLRFLVFDELHTYRGRQGADVGLLVRRIRAKSKHQPLCIGTSATMVSGEASLADQRRKVADVASRVFGAHFQLDQIVNETLDRSFKLDSPTQADLVAAIRSDVPLAEDTATLIAYPTAIWLESNVALLEKEGELVRNTPLTRTEIVAQLAADSGVDKEACERHLTDVLQWISAVNVQNNDSPYTFLPFKLHQFFAQTGSVYTSLDQGAERIITLEPGRYKVDSAGRRPIFPNVFSRASGESFLCVYKNSRDRVLTPREFDDQDLQNAAVTPGYVIVGDDIWNPAEDWESLPESWFKISKSGDVSIVRKYADRIRASFPSTKLELIPTHRGCHIVAGSCPAPCFLILQQDSSSMHKQANVQSSLNLGMKEGVRQRRSRPFRF